MVFAFSIFLRKREAKWKHARRSYPPQSGSRVLLPRRISRLSGCVRFDVVRDLLVNGEPSAKGNTNASRSFLIPTSSDFNLLTRATLFIHVAPARDDQVSRPPSSIGWRSSNLYAIRCLRIFLPLQSSLFLEFRDFIYRHKNVCQKLLEAMNETLDLQRDFHASDFRPW